MGDLLALHERHATRLITVPALAGLGAGLFALSGGAVFAVPRGQATPGHVHPTAAAAKAAAPAGTAVGGHRDVHRAVPGLAWSVIAAVGAAVSARAARAARRARGKGHRTVELSATAPGVSRSNDGQLQGEGPCAATAVSSAKPDFVHSDCDFPTPGSSCHPDGEAPAPLPCAAAAFISSAKSVCIHPDREFPYLCGDCPRNPKMAPRVPGKESSCIHPDGEGPTSHGGCLRNPKDSGCALEGRRNTCAAAAFISSAKSACIHPDREFPYLCGDCPRN
mmetsp:Transcript_1019/g.2898  ORF Transcript_1019/g.2898 Transcript_1019/m.2898 type:complete len:278 (-) Transcript_1019:203-1036(-)